MASLRSKVHFILLSLAIPFGAMALEVSSSVSTDQIWRRGDSPIDVTTLITVERGAQLTIEPGVVVKFTSNAGIIVYGNFVAEGTEAAPIVFTSSENDQPGSWGGLYLRNPDSPQAYDAQNKPNGKGTRLVHCLIENGGNSEVEGGSVLGFKSSSPYIAHTTVRNSLGITGSIRCLNSAEPLFYNCRIEGNVATRGGAIASSIGSKPVLIECSLIGNEAKDNGGAIYLSLADINITRSIINGNKAGSDGGAIYAARVADLTLIDNVFEGNRSVSGSNILFMTDLVGTNLKGNNFEAFGMAIKLQKAENSVDATENYWGDPGVVNFGELFRDRNDDASEPLIKYSPALYAPSKTIPVNPLQINKIVLCRTDSFTDVIPRGVANGAPLRIRLEGSDANPGFIDAISVNVVSELDNDGIVVALLETGPSTGVYTGRAAVAEKSNQKAFLIGSREGGSVSIFSPVKPEQISSYNTLTPKPIAENVAISGVTDLTHLTDHLPQFAWAYYEPLDRPQKSFKVAVSTNDGVSVWNALEITGEDLSLARGIVYGGEKLEDGESYVFQITVNSGKFWSEPVTLPFRMNSLPTAPVPVRPTEGMLAPTRSPQLVTGISSDREGDALTYSFEIQDISGGTGKQEKSELKGAGEVAWTPGELLVENGTYRFRAKAADSFESGVWGEYRLFYINSVEESPLAFDIVSPNNADVYDLHPTLDWETAVDPDPLSNVMYSIEISKGGNWAQGRKYENLPSTSFRLPDSLDNKSEYQWRVTATDNTGRKTMSNRVAKFRVETTPSVPLIAAPRSGEERKPDAALSWNASTDPNPHDAISYEIEVFKDATQPKILASTTGLSATNIAIQQLQGWESLADNTIYQWRVKARDNHNAASEFSPVGSFFNNSRNDTPTPPATVTAPAAIVTGTTTVTFGWQPGTDADLSDGMKTLVYEIEAVVGTFETGEIRRFRSAAGDAELSATLDDNKVWKYRLRTVDDDGAASGWTVSKEVLVNSAEDSPTSFVLLYPASGETVAELDSIRLTWASSSDPDWNSSIRYKLELTGTDGKIVKYETSATEYLHKAKLINESTYSWKVTAIDNTARETVCNSEFTIRTNTTPTIPTRMEIPPEILPNGRLTWGASSDPNPRDRLTYTIEIAGDENFTPVIVHKESIVNTSGMISVGVNELPGLEKLKDDQDYLFQVRATDNHGFNSAWSPGAKFRFNLVNDVPTAPGGPLEPSGSKTITDRSPILRWNASTDEDLSDPVGTLTYEVRLDADGELTKNSLYEFSTAPGAVQFSVPMPLTDNSPWVWAVRAKDDGGGVSAWSALQSFMVNVQEDAPTPPVALKPYNGQAINTLGPVWLGWIRSIDPDFKSSITYRIEYGTSPSLTGASQSADLKDSTFTIQGPLENLSYYWRIIAKDNTGLETNSSIGSFIIDTRPTMPQPAIPSGGVEVKPDGRFAWSGSVDPNPADVITYTIQISTDAGFGTTAVELSGLKETTVVMSAPGLKGKLADNQHYYWHVRATDNHKIESAFGSVAEFIYNEKNDPPSSFILASPADASHHQRGEIKLNWSNADDPDPGSRITYTLMVARDAKFTDRTQRFTGLSSGEFTVPSAMIEAGATYYWRVSAEDGLGGTTYGSGSDKTPWKFQIDMPPPPPPPPVEPPPVAPAPGTGTPGQ